MATQINDDLLRICINLRLISNTIIIVISFHRYVQALTFRYVINIKMAQIVRVDDALIFPN